MAAHLEPVFATRFHCVACGAVWGEGVDIGSSGLCIGCLAVWAKTKKPCFGSMCQESMGCRFYNYCKEHYGIKYQSIE